MHLLHFIPQFPWFGGRTIVGGHASCLFTLALAQVAAGDEVTILTYMEGHREPVEIVPGLTVHSLLDDARPGTVAFGLQMTRAAERWARRSSRAFDVVHGHSGFADYFIVTRRLSRILKRPSLHTLYCPIPASGGRWRLPGVHTLVRGWANGLDARVAMSENVAGAMRDYGLRDVRVITPALDLARFTPPADPAPARAELGLGADDVAVLFVGNAKPQKNLSAVLRAFREIRRSHANARLVVTTELKQSSSDERLAALRQEMVDLGLEASVIQRGIVEDMPRLMQACDLLVAPFLDSFGPSDYFMAALEAMACGRPVVVSAVGGMPEVVSDRVGRLVDPHDDEQITAALEALVADPAARRAAGAEARSYTERHFDPSRVADQYRGLYAELAK